MSNSNALVPANERKRTTVQLQVQGDPWPVLLAWCQARGYNQTLATADARVFKKGLGFWVAPRKLAAHVVGDTLTLQAWVHGTFIARLFSFFILPAEMPITSGWRGALPRKMMRTEFNQLLQDFGAPPVS